MPNVSTMSNIPTTFSGLLHSDSGVVCVPHSKAYIMAELIMASTSFVLTLFLSVTLVVFRSQLRAQVVNIYAANVVIACTVNNLARCFDTAWCYYGFSGPRYVSDGVLGENVTFLHNLWQVQKTTIIAMYVVIAGGIALVVMALRANFFRVHSTVAGSVRAETNTNAQKEKQTSILKRFSTWREKNRKLEARIFIATSWIVPLGASIIEVAANLCLSQCVCVFNYLPQNESIFPCGENCSVIWPPISNFFLVFGCVVWVLYAVGLVILLAWSHVDFKRVRNQMTATNIQIRDSQRSSGLSAYELEQQRYERTQRHSSSPTFSGEASCLLLDTLIRQLMMLAVISIAYIFGTGYLVCFVFYSVFNKDHSLFLDQNGLRMLPAFIFPTLCETFAAVTLCVRLPRLRLALRSMFFAFRNCLTCERCGS